MALDSIVPIISNAGGPLSKSKMLMSNAVMATPEKMPKLTTTQVSTGMPPTKTMQASGGVTKKMK